MLRTFDMDETVFRSFLFYASILVGKTMIMSPLTACWRFKKRVFISPEDAILRGTRVGYDDEDIERIRRAHRNDIENIPMFLFAAIMYMLTGPIPWVAINLFRLYTLFRFIHTYVYAIRVYPQPARAIAWGISYLINWYMIINSAVKFASL